MQKASERRRALWPWVVLGLGIALDLAGSLALVYGVVTLGNPLITTGQLWFRLDVGSLNLVQAVIQRYVYPPLWDGVIVPILLVPAFLLFALPGAALIVAGILGLRRN